MKIHTLASCLLAATVVACGTSPGGATAGTPLSDGQSVIDKDVAGDSPGAPTDGVGQRADNDANSTNDDSGPSGSDSSGASTGGQAPFIPPPPAGQATRWVSPDGDDKNPGTQAKPWRQIVHAAEQVVAGDVVEIAPGTYKSPVILAGKKGSAAKPIIFRAAGPGVFIDGSGADGSKWDRRDAIYIYESSYILLHGLEQSKAKRAGCRVSLSHHVTVQGCTFSDNGTWGIFSDFANDLALLGNTCTGSVKEHGIYHSNSGDRARIAGTLCRDNKGAGIQINADPAGSASQKEDGISSDCVIERNLLINNGKGGGAAINLASVRATKVRNNLAWGNLGTGIGMWDDGQGSQWGCKDNLIEHNTIVQAAAAGRFAITLWHGSTGNTIRNNILVGGARGAISYTTDSLADLKTHHNLYFSAKGWHLFEDEKTAKKRNFGQWQKLVSSEQGSAKAMPTFVDGTGGDYHLTEGSAGVDQGADSGLPVAYDGAERPLGAGYDIGAFER